MPASRREILTTTLAAFPVLTASAGVLGSESRAQKQLVVLFLTGGNDGLNTLIPYKSAAYHHARPTLAVRDSSLPLDDRFALHPALGYLKYCYDQRKVAIVHGCGYPNPSRSHYRSTQIWMSGKLDKADAGDSWLGLSRDPRIAVFHLDGFDMHCDQLARHHERLAQLDRTIASLQDPNVVTLVISEFGRRLAENSSGGTDHGAAGPIFIIGEAVSGGQYGQPSSLCDLHDGDLRYTTDFRRVYATVLDRWINVESARPLGARFEPLAFL